MEKTTAKKNKKTPVTGTLSTKVYDQKGKESSTFELAAEQFGLGWNRDLVHQVVTSMLSNARANTAHTKFRGEVSGTGKKPWKQKGTGRARHGSTRSPIWVGGGVAHGPRNERNYTKKINKKMKSKAFFTLLSKKFKDGQVLFVDTLSLSEIKTKSAATVVAALAGISGFEKMKNARKPAAYIALAEKNQTVEKSFANLPNVELGTTAMLSPLDVLNHKYLVFVDPEATVKSLSARAK
ncbi:MAG: 50S ribosomal protein L4 [Candidatus Pacebacteria bacterium]|jgi:large subunit ribosomal protein L4|nr:50S ribosomal protein L4 [Candidatus Paceibacterota bacterium]